MAPALAVTNAERRELAALSARSAPQGVALRARIVLGAADGVANKGARQIWEESCGNPILVALPEVLKATAEL